MRMLAWRLFITLCVLLPSATYSQSFSDNWDREFGKQTKVFLPAGTDWLLLKAQCYQESRLRPFAVSPVGASGLCQFMPGTWREAMDALDLTEDDVWLPRASIRAAAWYMGRLHNLWSSPRPAMDRAMISMASYNAGAGHLLDAQRRCDDARLYSGIIPCLPAVTGHHADETQDYVQKIVRVWYPRMLLQ